MGISRARRLFLACMAFIVLGAGPAPAAVGPGAPPAPWQPRDEAYVASSSNWSGYAAWGGRYSSVSARWRQPAANCAPGESSTAGFWVGFDGVVSSTVEQIGTISACVDGAPAYVGFYEAYPKRPVAVPHPLAPGDVVAASVSTAGRRRFEVSLINETAGWTFKTTIRSPRARRSSAEVIAEAARDISSGNLVPLTNFGTVVFDDATIDGKPLDAAGAEAVVMHGDDGRVKAEPSALSGGDAFSVTWFGP